MVPGRRLVGDHAKSLASFGVFGQHWSLQLVRHRLLHFVVHVRQLDRLVQVPDEIVVDVLASLQVKP